MANQSIPAAASVAPPQIEVAAGLIFRRSTLLITQRYPDSHLGGLWEFPGGKREANETFEQCLHRELREELGIDVVVIEVVDSIVHAYPEKTVLLKFFRCSWQACEPQPLGCPDFRWVTREELSAFAFPPADQRLLGTIQQRVEWWRS